MVLFLDTFSGQRIMLSYKPVENMALVLNAHTKKNLTEHPGLTQSTKWNNAGLSGLNTLLTAKGQTLSPACYMQHLIESSQKSCKRGRSITPIL